MALGWKAWIPDTALLSCVTLTKPCSCEPEFPSHMTGAVPASPVLLQWWNTNVCTLSFGQCQALLKELAVFL